MGPIIKDWDCNTAWQVWRHATSSDFPISVFLSSPWKVLVSVSQAWLARGCKLHTAPDKPGRVPVVEAPLASSGSAGAATVGHQHPAVEEDMGWHHLVRQSCYRGLLKLVSPLSSAANKSLTANRSQAQANGHPWGGLSGGRLSAIQDGGPHLTGLTSCTPHAEPDLIYFWQLFRVWFWH